VRGFLMQEKRGPTPALSFDELFVNLELQSLIRLAPVIKELRLVKPTSMWCAIRIINIFQDLIDEFLRPLRADAKIALNNIKSST
jgi:hypothetical protein